MNAWFDNQNIVNVRSLPDGNGDLANSLGMSVSKRNLNFGQRSWRYAMLVVNGTVELFCPEPNLQDDAQEDPYGSSTPEQMLIEVQSYLQVEPQITEDAVEEAPSEEI